jgi:DNA-binding beta-propeller fold protein YncE
LCPGFPDQVYRISPGTLDVVASIPVSRAGEPASFGGFVGAATGDGAVWVLYAHQLVRVDVANNRSGQPFSISGDAVTVGQGRVWVSDALAGTITALDSRTLEVVGTTEVAGSIDAIVAGEGGVWVLNGLAGTVTRIDPVTYQTSDPIGGVGVGATDIDAGGGSLWVTNPDEGTITVIDSLTSQVTSIDTGVSVAAIAVDRHSGSVYSLVHTL